MTTPALGDQDRVRSPPRQEQLTVQDEDDSTRVTPISPEPPLTTSKTLAAVSNETGSSSRRGAFSGGLWSAASAVLPMAGTLALSIVTGRRLGTSVLGEQSLVAYVASSITHVLVFSVTIASVQLIAAASGAGEGQRAAWLSRWSYQVHVATGVVSASFLLAGAVTRDHFKALWILSALVVVVDSFGWAHACRNIAHQGWGPSSSRRLVAQVVSPFLAIAAIYAGLGIDAVFGVQLVVGVVLTVVLRSVDRRSSWLPSRQRPAPPWRPVLRMWGMFVLSGLIFQIVERRLELIFLDRYHDARTVAMYSVAFSFVAIPTTLLGSLIGAAMPAIAARNSLEPQAVRDALSRAARVLVTLELLVVAGTITVGPSLVMVAYGAPFGEAAVLVRWLSLVLFVTPLGQLYATFWSGTGRLRPVLVAGGCAAVVDVALAWVLVPSLAGTGAVVATMSAQVVSAGVLMTHTYRSGVRLDLRPRRLARAALVALASGAAAALLTTCVGGILGVVLAVPGFLVVLALGAKVVGLFERVDVEWVAGTVPGLASRLVLAMSPRA